MPTSPTLTRHISDQPTCVADTRDWRCRCRNLLGKRRGDRLEVRFTRGHQYTMSLPVSVVCRCCGRLNELHPALIRG